MKTAQKAAPKKASTAARKSPSKQSQQSTEATGLRDLFEDSLKDIYWAEKALTKAMAKISKKASSEELVTALTEHLAITEEQVTRLEDVFSSLGVKAQAKKCEAMEGLIREANEIIENTAEGVVRDAGIIAAVQKVEHYEIATYGTLCAFAKILGEDEAAEMLLQTLNEEKEADDNLSEVAEVSINLKAAGEDADEDAAEDAEEEE